MPAKKYTFECIECGFTATSDRKPAAAFVCVDCHIYLGLCIACRNDLIAIHQTLHCKAKKREAGHAPDIQRR